MRYHHSNDQEGILNTTPVSKARDKQERDANKGDNTQPFFENSQLH